MILESVNKNFYKLNISSAIENFPYKTAVAFVQYARNLGYVFSGDDLNIDEPHDQAEYFFKNLKNHSNLLRDIRFVFIKKGFALQFDITKKENELRVLRRNYDIMKDDLFDVEKLSIGKNYNLSQFFEKMFKDEPLKESKNFLYKKFSLIFKNNMFRLVERDSSSYSIYNSNTDKNRKILMLNFIPIEIEDIEINSSFMFDFIRNYKKIINLIEKQTGYFLIDIIVVGNNEEVKMKFIDAQNNEKIVKTLRHETVEKFREETIRHFEKKWKNINFKKSIFEEIFHENN